MSSGNPPPGSSVSSPESSVVFLQAPAHVLYVELATRITTRRLHYRSGDEEAAARSLHSLFATTRKLMSDHPGDSSFQMVALVLLNDILRPYTARWHGWMTQDGDKVDGEGKPVLKLRDEWVRRKFREELRELQPLLLGAQKTLLALATGVTPKGEWLNPPLDSEAYGKLLEKWEGSSKLPELDGELTSEMRRQVILCKAGKDGRSGDKCADEILKNEHDHIRERRKAMGRDSGKDSIDNVFGLALSGGGIRSATFCLGVIQALHKRDLFNQVDYLSTVSGGGYLGTFLTSYLGYSTSSDQLSDDPKTRVDEVLGKKREAAGGKDCKNTNAEPPPVRHLRNNSKYLLNGGAWALPRIAAVFLTGLFASLVMLLTIPLVLAWFSLAVKALWGPGPDLLSSVAGWLPGTLETATLFTKPGGSLLLILCFLSLLSLVLKLFFQRLAEGKPRDSGVAKARNTVETTCLVVAILTVGLAALCASYVLVEQYEAFRKWLKEVLESKQLPAFPEWLVATASAVASTILGLLSKRKDGSPRQWAAKLFLLAGPLFFLLTFTIIASHLGVGNEQADLKTWGIASLVLLGVVFIALNINTFAPHRYYRDRLCECYLAVPETTEKGVFRKGIDSLVHGSCVVRERASTKVGTVRSVPLSSAGQFPAAPYHLINAVLNAEASRNPELRGRNGDFFLFSRHWCGSPLTGYTPTTEMEAMDPEVDLGTAMAISGAAASTNMGSKTMRDKRFLLTLFNVRLGYWMRRPGLNALFPRFHGPGIVYFLREMTGAVNERTRYVNLSDGGHIENLAAYELLRRQCKFIVCVDAGMEPGMECADLMRLQRLAGIDFGIRMHFDLTDLTVLPTSYSRAYAILVKIDYAPSEAEPGRETSDKLGWMLYLKLAVTGTEPRHILDYRRQNPAFPHQSTGDQLYDEAQFESYRALGECALTSLFRQEIIGRRNEDRELAVKEWFQCLAGSLLPDNDEIRNNSGAAHEVS